MAVKQGHTEAQQNLAVCHLQGQGACRGMEKGRGCRGRGRAKEEGRPLGRAAAQCNLGACY
jgi:TPR repeat protein